MFNILHTPKESQVHINLKLQKGNFIIRLTVSGIHISYNISFDEVKNVIGCLWSGTCFCPHLHKSKIIQHFWCQVHEYQSHLHILLPYSYVWLNCFCCNWFASDSICIPWSKNESKARHKQCCKAEFMTAERL